MQRSTPVPSLLCAYREIRFSGGLPYNRHKRRAQPRCRGGCRPHGAAEEGRWSTGVRDRHAWQRWHLRLRPQGCAALDTVHAELGSSLCQDGLVHLQTRQAALSGLDMQTPPSISGCATARLLAAMVNMLVSKFQVWQFLTALALL